MQKPQAYVSATVLCILARSLPVIQHHSIARLLRSPLNCYWMEFKFLES